MDTQHFDTLARSVASGLSRRAMLRHTARAALASPLGIAGATAVHADGHTKDKAKEKDRDRGQDTGVVTVTAPGGDASAAAQTVVQTNNQVCAGDCAQTNQQVVDTSVNQAVLAGSPTAALRPPTYLIDLSCTFDAPSYRTTCTGTSQGQVGAPLVRKIDLPRDGFCAVVLSVVSEPEQRERVPRPAPASGSNVASAGNGGVANANANGGSVTIGDVQGSNKIGIDASGGTANADASGGTNTVAVAGGSQTTDEVVEQIVAPSTLTVELEGNVVPGKLTTYWLDTAAGRRPAAGPTLVQVADQTTETGIITIDTWTCPVSQPDPSFDWFGQCTSPAATMQFSLYPESGGTTPLATGTPGAEGRVRFANLPPGTYQVQPEGASWCHAESDHVDAKGNVIVEAQAESHVWSFVCAPGGS